MVPDTQVTMNPSTDANAAAITQEEQLHLESNVQADRGKIEAESNPSPLDEVVNNHTTENK
eukprot:1809559-Ditylum_brightwellii.AAC.2